jgi:opacity protein-like surface antigen
MKKIYFSTFSAALFVIFLAFQTNAQITFQAGVGAGYSVPMGDYGGTTIDFYNGTKYGMKSGTNFHGKARVGFLFINAFGEIGYSTFSGSGESEPGKGSVDISNKIFSIKLGPEYAISIPLSPITPYFQGFVALNTFSGSVEFQGVTGVPSGKSDIASATRIGLGAGAGVMFSLGGLKLDVSAQYHLLNVAPKEYKISNVTSHTRLDNYTNINDDKDPVAGTTADHFISDSRGISALEFKLSVMFGL